MQKTRASRGAKAGLELSAVAADNFETTAKPLSRQAAVVAQRCRLPASVAAVVAELAFPSLDTWRAPL